jgi:hypothetical protein
MKHGVLKHFHPMMGFDWHVPWPPGSPVPTPPAVAYKTFSLLWGMMGAKADYSPNTLTDHMGWTMLQGTDIGPLIAHIGPPSLTMPIEYVLSASKSLFGISSYQIGGKPVAASLTFLVNPNLNCGTPVSLPVGVVLALTTHRLDMTWADICGGFARMTADMMMQFALNKLGTLVGDKVFHGISQAFGERVFFNGLLNYVGPETPFAVSEALAFTRHFEWLGNVYRLTGPVVGLLLGSPLGVDASTLGLPTANTLVGDLLPGDNRDVTTRVEDKAAERLGSPVAKYLDATFPDDDGPGDYPLPTGDEASG